MYHLKKLDVLSLAKIQALLVMACMLIFLVLAFLFVVLAGGSYELRHFFELDNINYFTDLFDLFGSFSLYSMIGSLILSGIIGFVAGAVMALVYNLIASWLGGIKMEITLEEEEEGEQPKNSPPPPTQNQSS